MKHGDLSGSPFVNPQKYSQKKPTIKNRWFFFVDTMEKRFLIFPQRERQVLKINQILRNHLPIL